MQLIANSEAWPGIAASAGLLQAGKHGLDALISGISLVEREVTASRQ